MTTPGDSSSLYHDWTRTILTLSGTDKGKAWEGVTCVICLLCFYFRVALQCFVFVLLYAVAMRHSSRCFQCHVNDFQWTNLSQLWGAGLDWGQVRLGRMSLFIFPCRHCTTHTRVNRASQRENRGSGAVPIDRPRRENRDPWLPS